MNPEQHPHQTPETAPGKISGRGEHPPETLQAPATGTPTGDAKAPRGPRHRTPDATGELSGPGETNQGRDTIADQFIHEVAADAPTTTAAETIRAAYASHGTAYALYLTLDGVDPYADTTEADYKSAYRGFYETRTALIDDTIDTFGWEQDRRRLLKPDPMVLEFTTLNRQAIWDFIAHHRDIIDLNGGLYVYEQWP